jgi:hypothetical protein
MILRHRVVRVFSAAVEIAKGKRGRGEKGKKEAHPRFREAAESQG